MYLNFLKETCNNQINAFSKDHDYVKLVQHYYEQGVSYWIDTILHCCLFIWTRLFNITQFCNGTYLFHTNYMIHVQFFQCCLLCTDYLTWHNFTMGCLLISHRLYNMTQFCRAAYFTQIIEYVTILQATFCFMYYLFKTILQYYLFHTDYLACITCTCNRQLQLHYSSHINSNSCIIKVLFFSWSNNFNQCVLNMHNKSSFLFMIK